MIAKLRGVVDQVGEDWAVIDVRGVGYLVSCPGRTLASLVVGGEASLAVETQLREDRLQLFGFSDALEREWFRVLQTVQGVGGRLALAILTVLGPDDLARAIASGDRAALQRADGVGPRVAARLITDLKDKAATVAPAFGVSAPARGAAQAPTGNRAAMDDAVSALVNLGYGRSEAFAAVANAAAAQGDAATADALIRAGLKDLAREVLR